MSIPIPLSIHPACTTGPLDSPLICLLKGTINLSDGLWVSDVLKMIQSITLITLKSKAMSVSIRSTRLHSMFSMLYEIACVFRFWPHWLTSSWVLTIITIFDNNYDIIFRTQYYFLWACSLFRPHCSECPFPSPHLKGAGRSNSRLGLSAGFEGCTRHPLRA